MREVIAIYDKTLSHGYDKRYVIVDKETREVLDDAQGYGYKSPQGAHAAWSYKNRSKAEREEWGKKKRHIIKWLDDNPNIVIGLVELELDILKGREGQDAKFNVPMLKRAFKDSEIEVDFEIKDLLKVWRNYDIYKAM